MTHGHATFFVALTAVANATSNTDINPHLELDKKHGGQKQQLPGRQQQRQPEEQTQLKMEEGKKGKRQE